MMTPEVIKLLEHAYGYGASDVEACEYAGISESTLYDYIKKHPEFSQLKVLKQSKTNLVARKVVYEEMMNTTNVKRGSLALDYLKAKLPQEFAPRNSIDLGVSEELKESLEMTKEMFDEVMNSKFASAKKKPKA